MRLPPLSHIRAFESAARHESFNRAASELGMSAAAVSQHIRSLEDWMGISLFSRQPQGVRLTMQGRVFGQACSNALSEIAASADAVIAKNNQKRVSLACQPSLVSLWLAPRLHEFTRLYPEIGLSIVYPFGARQPEDINADLLLSHGKGPILKGTEILSAATRPTCAKTYFLQAGPFDNAGQLLGANLLHDETQTAWQEWFQKMGIAYRLNSAPVFADFNLLVGSVKAGHGIGLCPTSLIVDDIASGDLVVLFEQAGDLDKFYWLVERDTLSPEAQLLRNWLLAEAEKSNALKHLHE